MNCCGQSNLFKPRKCLYLTIFLMMVLSDFAASVTTGSCSQPKLLIQMTENTRKDQAILDMSANVVWTFGPGTPLGMKDLFEIYKSSSGSEMTLKKTIDLEDPSVLQKIGGSNEFLLNLTCKDTSTNNEKSFSMPLSVQPINEFAPEFNTTSIQRWAKETIPDPIHWRWPKPKDILHLRKWVSDKDYNKITEITRFELQRAAVGEKINGLNVLQLKPVKGYLQTSEKLDFENLPKNQKFVVVKVVAYDQGGLSGTSTVTVHVEDQDDRRPYFYLPDSPRREYFRGYTVTVAGNYTGPITDKMQPAPIRVRDGDTLNATVTLAFTRDNPARLGEYISLDSRTGNVTILKGLRDFDNGRRIYLIIGATENTKRRLYGKTFLVIKVRDSPSRVGVKIRTIVLGMATTLTCCLVILAVGLTLIWWNREEPESKPSIVKEERDHTSWSEKLSLQPEVIHNNGETSQ